MHKKSLKQLILSVVTLAVIVSIPRPGVATSDICGKLESYQYTTFRDDGPGQRRRGYVCFIVKDSPNEQGILTLKHLNNRGNWDVLVGTHFDPASKKVSGIIDYENNRGTVDELVFLPNNSHREYVVVAFPRSDTPSNACLIFHRFDTGKIAADAFAMTVVENALEYIFSGGTSNQEVKNATSRAVNLGLSMLQKNNLASVGYDAILNEISIQLTNFFGGGSWLFDFGVNYWGGYLEQSGKFLWDRNMRCTE